jgi:plasmid stabilization system protein ParE
MSLPPVFHPDVQGEVDEAYSWYEQQRPGLGDDFLAALEDVYNRLQQTPEAHQVIYLDVRRGLPRRFPYGVYYRVLAKRVEVIAVQKASILWVVGQFDRPMAGSTWRW